ncbi:hypothetical protein QBC46DRAFT_438313 [Diplogelasinospora grovesii]|uniref:Uncharacterized protein n=1 Tax=Diplogelasinospora grovesii TaxID=303347 RepID=A0AAN6N4S2_9PEZI|nr:hypothetical protein QBC46DRAFT_438313 [Diplogelasinospora grovesii]
MRNHDVLFHLSPFLTFLLLLAPIPAHAFRWVNNANFTACYNDIIQPIAQNCSDTANQVCLYDPNGVLLNPNRIFITYSACERLCGDGYGIWDTKDILLRISLWVIPAIVLIAHYHFPPLGAWNMICVIAHILADPIDTLWCLLTRITVRRHLLRRAEDQRLLRGGSIATIWAAYDELNFHDPSAHFLQSLRELSPHKGYPVGFLRVKGETSRSLESAKLHSDLDRRCSNRRDSDFESWDRAIQDLSPDERRILYHIEKAAQRLVFNRDESSLTTWMSIFGLGSALMGAFVRTWSNRLDNQTAHTIATVTLLLVVVPIVKLSGNIGAFTSSTAALHIIHDLRDDLTTEFGFDANLFPPLAVPVVVSPSPSHTAAAAARYHRVPGDEILPLTSFPAHHRPSTSTAWTSEDCQLLTWPSVACYSGMNSSYRPAKSSSSPDLVSPIWSLSLLLVSVIWVLGFCYTPALLISYYTPLKGFACRSMAWTVIAVCWLLALLLDRVWVFLHRQLQGRWIEKAENLWRATCIRDVLFTGFIALIVTAQQLGLYNSCFCRAGEVTHSKPSYVNLTPFTDAEFIEGWEMWVPTPGAAFLLSLACIFVLESRVFARHGYLLLGRGNKEREAMLLRLRRLKLASY